MDITAKYEGKNFFGFNEYMECTERYTELTAKKAVAGLKKSRNVAIHIHEGQENTVFYYDSLSDFENGIITTQHSKSYYNVDAPVKMSFTKAKKMIMQYCKESA